jgi:hypothetical protein
MGWSPLPCGIAIPLRTVKPLALMDWLVKLVTPPGGTCLDPFLGSGSTGCSAVRLGFNFVGIERSEEYAEIARRRIAFWAGPQREQSAKAPPRARNAYGFRTTDVLRRCPDHGEPIPSRSTTYKCGCKKIWHEADEGPPPQPDEVPLTLFDD